MASEQLARRGNTTTERDVQVEKDRVPKMATHFEHLTDKAKDSDVTGAKDTPQGSIEALQGGQHRQEHAGKAIGDVGGSGKARESHELGTHFESLADKVKGKESDHPANAASKGAVKEREGGGGGVGDVGKFEMKGEGEGNKRELERRTKEVNGGREKERGRESRAQVVAEKGTRNAEKPKARTGVENEGATAVITCKLEKGDEERGREEEIPKYTDETKATQAKQEKKDGATKDTITPATDKAKGYTAQVPATDKAKGYTAQVPATDKAKGYTAQAPATDKAKGYTAQAAEKAKSAGSTTAQYVGEKAVQAKDVTVEGGKSAAGYAGKVASDLKDKATAAGWAAAHFSADKTVQGTKAAAQAVEGVAGYAGHKAADLASKSVETVKGLAASAGETAKEYTARKKEEARRELEAKKASQPQKAEERAPQGIGETITGGSTQQEGTGKSVLSTIGETVGNVGEKIKKPFEKMSGEGQQGKGTLDNITKGGTEVLGAVGETVGEIGENIIKPAEKAQEQGQEGQQGGVLDAIGETIVEIANTTKVMVAGGGEKESSKHQGAPPESRLTDTAKRQGYQSV
ncbi:hypothetical protein VNO77_28444 [Canavalia gladiata]|uniref:Seed biotin-containing protein SBP65 n=1 Tax=Canavalia gladiata TaxID=3824 RepID=A0AAN9KW44_CANGL